MRNKLLAAAMIASIAGVQDAVGSLAGQSSLGIVQSVSAPKLNPPATRRESRTHSADSPFGYQSGPGWTCAHVRRMAKKQRNQARNKRAARHA